MKKIKWSEKVTNEQVIEHKAKNRTFLNNIIRRKANWIGHILRINCLLHDYESERSRKKKNSSLMI